MKIWENFLGNILFISFTTLYCEGSLKQRRNFDGYSFMETWPKLESNLILYLYLLTLFILISNCFVALTTTDFIHLFYNFTPSVAVFCTLHFFHFDPNIQKLIIEVYKSLNESSADNYFDSLFTWFNDLLVPSVKTVTKSKDSAKYLRAVTWNSVLSHIRQQDSLEKFRDLTEKWKSDCNCKLCKDYIGHIGYMQIVE